MNELVAAVPWLGKRNPTAARWLIILVAIAAPFIAWQFGRSWVRILDFALLYMMLALGLNLVVGFAGLLDLGYIAFYAVGAYTFAFLILGLVLIFRPTGLLGERVSDRA